MPFPWQSGSWGSGNSSWGDSWGDTSVAPPPPVIQSGLRHFRASHFSKLRHFNSVHFAGIEVEIEVRPAGNQGGTKSADIGTYVPYPRQVVVVRIKRNGEIWESIFEVNPFTAEIVRSVIATALKFDKAATTVSVKVKDFGINITKPVVKAFKK